MTRKHEKFRELAVKRTNNAIEAILRIGNLSNRQQYEFGFPLSLRTFDFRHGPATVHFFPADIHRAQTAHATLIVDQRHVVDYEA